MGIGPLSRISNAGAQESVELTRQLVTALRGLNRQQFLAKGRELKLRRGTGRRPSMVDLVDLETGEVLDELPPEQVLRMMSELEKQRDEEL